MSGIVGVWNLDGAPVDPGVLAAMNNAMVHRGPDGSGSRIAGPVGLACQHLWITAEDVGETQPLVSRSGAALVWDGRLDNREELLGALSLPATASDAACVLAAYDEWGEACPDRLNGDFAFAIFDPRQPRLVLARDVMGLRPVFWYRDARRFAFASEIKALLAHPDVPLQPDHEGLADYVVFSGVRPIERQALTCFAGISSIVPAHVLVSGLERHVVRRYWDYDTGRTLRLSSFAEYCEAFHERFLVAVRRRARSRHPVAVSLSGGLDSSSIISQAEVLRRQGRLDAPGLVGITYQGPAGGGADEERYVADIERQYGITVARIAAEPFLGIADAAEEQIRAVEAPFLDHLWGVSRAVYRSARAAGARVLLTGLWGDQMLFSTAYLIDLFHRLRWGELRAHLREYDRWCDPGEARSLGRRFVRGLLRQSVPEALVPPLKWIRRRFASRAPRKRWLADSIRRLAYQDAHRPATAGRRFHSQQARALYIEARSKYHVQCMVWNNNSAAHDGLVPAFPFLDRDLVAFLMAVPGDVHSHGGVPRALLREGLRDVLPPSIRERKGKADFTTLGNASVARDIGILQAALTDSVGVRRGYFHPGPLREEVARLSLGLVSAVDAVEAWELEELFGLEMWFRVFLEGGGNATVPVRPEEVHT